MRKVTQHELNAILTDHEIWYASDGKRGCRADLSDTDLSEKDLSHACLGNSILSGANLSCAYLYRCCGNGVEIKGITTDIYDTCYTYSMLWIGCEYHPIEDWKKFDDDEIFDMDGEKAILFWSQNKKMIFDRIENDPAKPTGWE
jgi:uncharacterized protein YjbI with pentapeptide repeats